MADNTEIISKIKRLFTKEEIPAKKTLVKEGKTARKCYYIRQGAARVWFNTDDGKEVTFQFLFEGTFIASLDSLLYKAPSWYSIETIEPVVLYGITTEEFREKMELYPHVK